MHIWVDVADILDQVSTEDLLDEIRHRPSRSPKVDDNDVFDRFSHEDFTALR